MDVKPNKNYWKAVQKHDKKKNHLNEMILMRDMVCAECNLTI